MQSPSNSQKKAIKHGQGPMLVLAGPGSGKTFVMIQRILNLIHEKQVKPENILVISFSKASTLELKQRFQKQTNVRGEVNFATFHACFFHILKETYQYTSQDIISEQQKRALLKTILSDPLYEQREEKNCVKSRNLKQEQNKNELLERDEKQRIDCQKKNRKMEDGIDEKVEDYLQKISYYKNKGIKELKEKESKLVQQIFYAYNDEMHRNHKLDFDDMGLLCLQLFQSNSDILEKWQNKFQYILIDEFQDINMIQFRIVRLLVNKHKNLFVVGDDDQAIYGFRGSNPKIMLDFEKYYPDSQKVLLEINYRCSEAIVKEALKVIGQNKVRFPKKIKANSTDMEASYEEKKIGKMKGGIEQKRRQEVVYQGFENYQNEYSYITEQIKKLSEKNQYAYSDIACIFRTNQDMFGLAEYFARNKIPFVMKESCSSIFRHFIALDIAAYLQFFKEEKSKSRFLRIMNKPLRYISRNALLSLPGEEVTWSGLKNYYSSKNYMISNIEQLEQNDRWIQKLDLYGSCFYIRKVMGYEEYLKEYVKEKNMDWEEAKEILDYIQESTRNMSCVAEWKEYIEEYEEALKQSKEEKDGVQIITMHACKGLEYAAVFLPDCNEGKIPHKKAALPEEIEEERRMFYVAMTRAKFHLEILYIEDKLKKHLQPTRFMKHN